MSPTLLAECHNTCLKASDAEAAAAGSGTTPLELPPAATRPLALPLPAESEVEKVLRRVGLGLACPPPASEALEASERPPTSLRRGASLGPAPSSAAPPAAAGGLRPPPAGPPRDSEGSTSCPATGGGLEEEAGPSPPCRYQGQGRGPEWAWWCRPMRLLLGPPARGQRGWRRGARAAWAGAAGVGTRAGAAAPRHHRRRPCPQQACLLLPPPWQSPSSTTRGRRRPGSWPEPNAQIPRSAAAPPCPR